MSEEQPQKGRRWKRFVPPLLLLSIFGLAAVLFHHVLLPFFVAIFIVYLIEPVVARIARRKIAGRQIPRWGAVVSVYVTILTTIVVFNIIFLPQLGREVTSLANEAPAFFRELREERLPALQERINNMLSNFDGDSVDDRPFEAASEAVNSATADAEIQAILWAGLSEDERSLFEDLSPSMHDVPENSDLVVMRVRPTTQGELELIMDADAIHVERGDDDNYVVRFEAPEEGNQSPVDLEEALNQQLGALVETSGELAGEVINIGQELVTSIIELFVTLMITLMVAAFISIDLPAILAFFRGLFPDDTQDTVGELLTSLDKGLSGVIRGQLLICLVNGTLTTIGLAILGIKFAFILGVIAGVLSLIPIFGTIISTIPAVAVGLTQGFVLALAVLGWILVIHFIEANFLNPKIIGTTAEIHPAIIIFSLLAGEHSFGLMGALLAVPTASIVQTLFLFTRDHVWPKSQPSESSETDGEESPPGSDPPQTLIEATADAT